MENTRILRLMIGTDLAPIVLTRERYSGKTHPIIRTSPVGTLEAYVLVTRSFALLNGHSSKAEMLAKHEGDVALVHSEVWWDTAEKALRRFNPPLLTSLTKGH